VEPLPENLKPEIQTLGRPQYHRLRRVAAMLNYYRIDPVTIAERLVERGCSQNLADWIVRSASADRSLTKKLEESEAPETLSLVLMKGLNGVVLLVIVALVAHFIQVTDSMALLFIFSPFLLITAFVGFFMVLRMIAEIRRRVSQSRDE